MIHKTKRTGVLIQISRQKLSQQNPNSLASVEDFPDYANNEILFNDLAFVEVVPATRNLSASPLTTSPGQGHMWRVYIPKTETQLYQPLLGSYRIFEVRFNLSALYKNQLYKPGQVDDCVLRVDRWEIGAGTIGMIELNCISS